MTMARRYSSGTRGGSTAMTFSTSSCSSRLAANSSAGTCITSSSRTSRRCRRGRSRRRATRRRSTRWSACSATRSSICCGAARMFNREWFKERALQARQVAGRGRRQDAAVCRRIRDPKARLWRAVDEYRLYGPGPAQPAIGRGLAHRQGVDQQRLADGPHQLHGRKVGDTSAPGCAASSTG